MNDTMETIAWGAAILCFLTIAYKSYTSDDLLPSREEILEAVENGAVKALTENDTVKVAPDAS